MPLARKYFGGKEMVRRETALSTCLVGIAEGGLYGEMIRTMKPLAIHGGSGPRFQNATKLLNDGIPTFSFYLYLSQTD
jgi:hypothetical protein